VPRRPRHGVWGATGRGAGARSDRLGLRSVRGASVHYSTLRLAAARGSRSAAFRTKSATDCEAGALRRTAAPSVPARGPVPPTPAPSLTGRRSRHADLPPINKNAGVCRRLVRDVCKVARAANEATTTPSLEGRVPRSSPRSATPTSSPVTICTRSSGAPRGAICAGSSRRSPRRRCAVGARSCGSGAGRARSADARTTGRCGGRAASRGPRPATSPTAIRPCA
jgi:hypothetical protein